MKHAILIMALALASCEAPAPENGAAEALSEKRAVADAQEMIADNATRMETVAETETAEGESE